MQWGRRINRPDVRNVRPKTTSELYSAFYDAQEDTSMGLFCCLLKVLHQKMESTLL
jgi:1,4-dihydroxy-2-naphthoyl-CoA synthase